MKAVAYLLVLATAANAGLLHPAPKPLPLSHYDPSLHQGGVQQVGHINEGLLTQLSAGGLGYSAGLGGGLSNGGSYGGEQEGFSIGNIYGQSYEGLPLGYSYGKNYGGLEGSLSLGGISYWGHPVIAQQQPPLVPPVPLPEDHSGQFFNGVHHQAPLLASLPAPAPVHHNEELIKVVHQQAPVFASSPAHQHHNEQVIKVIHEQGTHAHHLSAQAPAKFDVIRVVNLPPEHHAPFGHHAAFDHHHGPAPVTIVKVLHQSPVYHHPPSTSGW